MWDTEFSDTVSWQSNRDTHNSYRLKSTKRRLGSAQSVPERMEQPLVVKAGVNRRPRDRGRLVVKTRLAADRERRQRTAARTARTRDSNRDKAQQRTTEEVKKEGGHCVDDSHDVDEGSRRRGGLVFCVAAVCSNESCC